MKIEYSSLGGTKLAHSTQSMINKNSQAEIPAEILCAL